ncbi:MAG: helix-turn-helix transcriptional regulator [Parasporobacterium sp.]|nr:helix-turn-helix transcriptional regulator [Parasporobacterium sp.]
MNSQKEIISHDRPMHAAGRNAEIGNRIWFLRSRMLKMTAEEFASELGMKRSRLERCEKGMATIPAEMVAEISGKYHISPAWLLGIDEKAQDTMPGL